MPARGATHETPTKRDYKKTGFCCRHKCRWTVQTRRLHIGRCLSLSRLTTNNPAQCDLHNGGVFIRTPTTVRYGAPHARPHLAYASHSKAIGLGVKGSTHTGCHRHVVAFGSNYVVFVPRVKESMALIRATDLVAGTFKGYTAGNGHARHIV